MRIGLFLKYDREVVKWSENREIPDLWGRVDRYEITYQVNLMFLLVHSVYSYQNIIRIYLLHVLTSKLYILTSKLSALTSKL